MEGCLAPSEIPGLLPAEYTAFGGVAERILGDDYRRRFAVPPYYLFVDNNNPLEFDGFLMQHNPGFTKAKVEDYKRRLQRDGYKKHRPDLLAHVRPEPEFYEIKPDSRSGWYAGTRKVGVLSATFEAVGLPYTMGMRFHPRDQLLAWLGDGLKVHFKARLSGPGLIQYCVCLKSDGTMELVTLAAVLRYVVGRANRQPKTGPFRPFDLAPGFRGVPLSDLARTLGLAALGTAVARAGWRHFWKAVVARFAVRGAAAATLAVVDGPLPVGDLIAAGLALWTVIDVIRFSSELWRDAEQIARQGA